MCYCASRGLEVNSKGECYNIVPAALTIKFILYFAAYNMLIKTIDNVDLKISK